MARFALPPFAFGAVLTSSLAGVLAAACDDRDGYVYTAQRFVPARGCLESYTAIEVVSGEGASATCPPICLTVDADLYVSSVCPPVPGVATAVGPEVAACLDALDAARVEASCSAAPYTRDTAQLDASDGG